MLTDPFYVPGPQYSATSTGIRELIYGSSYVDAGLTLVSILQDAGWTIEDSAPSSAVQTRYAWYFEAGVSGGTPRDMTLAECTTIRGPAWNRASAAGKIFNSYDPGYITPVCPGGTGAIEWFETGVTTADTADNLADKIILLNIWGVGVTSIPGDRYQFAFLSNAPAFEFDEIPIGVGSGDATSKRGYYILRSPVLGSDYLEIKIETRTVGFLGGFFSYDGVGLTRLCLTVTASGGGEYYMPLFPGTYNVCANNHQVALWPVAGATPGPSQNSSLLVSMIEGIAGHDTVGNCVMVVGNNNGDLITGRDQIRQTMHWAKSLASGHNAELTQTAWRAGFNTGYQTISMLVRGTKARPTVSLAGQPLIQAPYALVPSSPTSGPEAIIAGKLWDTVIISKGAGIGEQMMYDGRNWTCFSTSTPVNDVGTSMWIKTEGG